MSQLTWSDSLGKRVKVGDRARQQVPTLDEVRAAIAEAGDEFGLKAGRREVAAQLVDYFMEEAKVVYVIYDVWTKGFLEWLGTKDVPQAERDAEISRLKALLAFPDGQPYEPEPRWEALGAFAGRLGNRIRSYDITGAEADRELDTLEESWRQLHDRGADLMAGLLAFVARRFGESALEECYRYVMEPYIQERYTPFDVRVVPYEDTIERNLYISFEAMRAHLCGPQRQGTFDLEEHEDRWVVAFDPCGSGGRSMRGDAVEGTGSRVLEPYEFGVTQEKHDWAWNKEGICYYCAHCCLVLEKLPVERWGHPVRVVDPPVWGGAADAASTQQKCRWTIYKSLEAIPEERYQRIGHAKPQLPVIQPMSAAAAGATGDTGSSPEAGSPIADATPAERWLEPRD